MERLEIAQDVAKTLWATEEAIDDALNRSSSLVGELISARRRASLSTTAGHEAIESLDEVASHLVRARGALVLTHKRLDRIRKAVGIPTVADGPMQKPDEVVAGDQRTQPLRAVG